jgi:GNAT superfamily N-acetyltransferase
LDLVPFDDRFVAPAAALLAGAHPPAVDLADVAVAGRLVTGWRDAGPAVAAVRDGELVGFMAAALTGPPAYQAARVRLQQHAAAAADTRTIYRRLYAALSGRLVAAGAFEHSVVVSAEHRDTLSCLHELGFGVDQVRGLRPLTPPPATAPDTRVRLRPARADDVPRLLELTVELQRFHASPPMLRPALLDQRAIRDSFHATLAGDRQLLVAAERDGRLVGMMQAGPDGRYRDTATIGIAVVTASARSKGTGTGLLSAVLDWAGRHGFHTCGAEWTSANLVSDAFWRGHGFEPARYTLTRLIDSRVGSDPV